MDLITQILQVCLIPLLGVLTKYLIDFLNAKREEAKAKANSEIAKKYIDMINDTVNKCVIATNQTFVDSLKKADKFDAKAAEEAFNKTMNAVLATLAQDAKDYIVETSGDLKTYLTQLIEANVNVEKK